MILAIANTLEAAAWIGVALTLYTYRRILLNAN